MTKPAAFQAVYCNFKPVPSRNVVQIVLEIPMEQGDAVIKTLGMPNPEQSKWVAVAVLAVPKNEPTPTPGGLASASVTVGHAADGQADVSPARPKAPAAKLMTREQRRVQRAGFLCDNLTFHEFLKNDFPNEWRQAELQSDRLDDVAAIVLRQQCHITSRRELAHDKIAAEIFDRIEGQFNLYQQHPTTRGNYDHVSARE